MQNIRFIAWHVSVTKRANFPVRNVFLPIANLGNGQSIAEIALSKARRKLLSDVD